MLTMVYCYRLSEMQNLCKERIEINKRHLNKRSIKSCLKTKNLKLPFMRGNYGTNANTKTGNDSL